MGSAGSKPVNLHATAVVLGDRGVVIAGPSGAGKTSLARGLTERWRAAGRFARIVADDQVLLAAAHDGLLVLAPAAISGLVEVRGYGPAPVDHEPKARVDLYVALVPAGIAPRMAESRTQILAGCAVPRLDLPDRDTGACMAAIEAWLDGGPPP